MQPQLSLVIPAYNESQLLPRLLESVRVAQAACRLGPQAIEVIVADNASTDDTAAIALGAGCLVEPVEKRCIAAARNGGARRASGEILCFVDADSIVHPRVFDAIAQGLTDRVVGGTSRVVPERWSLGLRFTYLLILVPISLFDMDSGVVFCRRRDFEEIGGYNEGRLYAEDVEFLFALRRLGRSRNPRQKLTRLRGVTTLTSTRKYDKYGQWHFPREVLRHGLLQLLRPRATEEFALRYWYQDR